MTNRIFLEIKNKCVNENENWLSTDSYFFSKLQNRGNGRLYSTGSSLLSSTLHTSHILQPECFCSCRNLFSHREFVITKLKVLLQHIKRTILLFPNRPKPVCFLCRDTLILSHPPRISAWRTCANQQVNSNLSFPAELNLRKKIANSTTPTHRLRRGGAKASAGILW